jgi:hypothetical protein
LKEPPVNNLNQRTLFCESRVSGTKQTLRPASKPD